MAFNIKNFANGIARNGFAREGFFDVTITIPPKLKVDRAGYSRALNGLCTASNLPARQATLDAVKTDGLGVIRQFARGMQYSALDLTFYCDQNSNVIKFFNMWMDLLIDTKSNPGSRSFNMLEYRDNYTCPEISLNMYSDIQTSRQSEGTKTATWKFTEAFPISCGPTNFSWGSRNNLILFPVAFVYHQYTYEGQDTGGSVNNLSTQLQPSKYNNQPVTGFQPIGQYTGPGREDLGR